VRSWIDAALSVLFAPECAACRRPLEFPSQGAVCLECWASIHPLTPPLCERCGESLPSWCERILPPLCVSCSRLPRVIQRARAIGAYEGALRTIIHAFKYEGRRSLARPLATLMCTRGADVLRTADIAVAVPLHVWRRLERGFNQAEDLAKGVHVPLVAALARTRRTAIQADLPAAQRYRNVKGAFAPTRHAALVHGRRVVLIDDVSTTGATLDACAAVLRECGASEVFALTAARVSPTRR
jgi:ComF family protein